MGRLALLPRYREVHHLVGGGFESWTNPALPDGWTVVGGGNGTISKFTAEPFEELASVQIDKTASGAIYFVQPPRADMLPGLYYRIACARLSLQGPMPNQASARFVNITRNQCLKPSGAFVAGSTTNWVSPPNRGWFSQRLWFQVPSTFADSDFYEFRIGNFGALTSGTSWFDSCTIIGPYVRPIHLTGLAALTYAALARKEIVVVLSGPTGIEIDITRRVQLDGLGTITEGAEEEMLRLTHGDMTLTLDDRDGLLRGLFQDATATDRWELIVLTETGRVHGLKWDRLFAGVLDLPWSVSFNPRESETKIQVFSYSKELELKSAETVKRTLASKTASITAATSQLVFLSGEAADLEIGDTVRLNDGQNTEDFTISRIIDPSNAATSLAASRTFTSDPAQVLTAFYHDKGPYNLLDLIATDADSDFNVLNPKQPLADFPVATPYSIAGLNLSGIPMGILPVSGAIVATFDSSQGTKRKTSANPTATWADGATSNIPQLDWTPYHDTQPGIITSALIAGIPDTGLYAPDHFNDTVFRNVAGAGSHMHLYKNVSGGADIDLGSSSILTYPLVNSSVVVDPNGSGVYFSFKSATAREFRYWDGTFHTITTTSSGNLQMIRDANVGRLLVLVEHLTNNIQIWDLPGRTLGRTIPWANTTDRILHWTIRNWGDTTFGGAASKQWFTFLFERNNETWIAIFDSRGTYQRWTLAATYRVSGTISPRPVAFYGPEAYQTVLTLPGGEQVAVIYSGGEWLVLATYYAGVIRYADFTGLSCAGAIKELALITNSYFDADRYRSFNLTPRPSLLTAQAVQKIEDPLDRTSLPIWEFYRTACKVTGTDASGKGFTVIQGVDGGSAKTIEVSSPLITTPGMALAVATFYSAYLNRVVRQENIRIDEPEEPIRVLDIVDFDDAKWLVTDVQSNTRDREQTLRLFEVR